MSGLADRIRGIVGSAVAQPSRIAGLSDRTDPPSRSELSGLEQLLGGVWRQHVAPSCFVVERRFDPSVSYGSARVGDFAVRLAAAAADAPMLAGGTPAPPPFVYLDLETTGLSGGAGTHAFLVGCGWFDEEDGFVTRQYLMTRHADERPMLAAVSGELASAGALVSFNGKSFDVPLLETRYLFHRFEWCAGRLPHLDVLHPARRFWGPRASPDAGRGAESSCSLLSLEHHVLGARRIGDVAGFEIPVRYFQFVRSGDARPLAAVLEHNRLDLLSLAGLTAQLLHLVRTGVGAARDAREALALGCVYSRAGLDGRSREAYERAASGSMRLVTISALRELALAARRARRYDDAAGCWQRLLDISGCPPLVAREASEALAIHHEHRVRDLEAAKMFALKSLESGQQRAWTEAVHHRLARIERKIAVSGMNERRLL